MSESTSEVPKIPKDTRWFKHTRGEFWGAPTASTTIYKFLAMFPITGFLGLDHLYLRSPWTFMLKLIVNIFTFGFWYLYDLAQALSFNYDRIDKYGLALPILGPKGLGVGIFKGTEGAVKGDPEQAASSLMFLAYGTLGLLPFGLDYFAVNDTAGGILKFITSIPMLIGSIFSAKIAFILGLITLTLTAINWGILMFNPETIMCKGTPQYFPLTSFMKCQYRPMDAIIKKAPGAVNQCEQEECGDPAIGAGNFIFKNFTPMGRAASIAENKIKDVISKNPMASKILDKAKSLQGTIAKAQDTVAKAQGAIQDTVAKTQDTVAKAQGAIQDTVAKAQGAVESVQGAATDKASGLLSAVTGATSAAATDKVSSLLSAGKSLSSLGSLLKSTKGGGVSDKDKNDNPSSSIIFIAGILLIGGIFMAGKRAITNFGESLIGRPPEPFINLEEEEENVSDTPPRPSES